jgi:coatomer protein complex subunit gamma
VDRLLKQITSFLTDVPDEFKIVVGAPADPCRPLSAACSRLAAVEGVRQLALKFRDRHRAVLSLLGGCLHQDGGYAYKRAIVEAIVAIVEDVPDSRGAPLGCPPVGRV